ncbi:MAG TPA: DUF2950 domain-containing protein [Gemmatimonadales bacterium]|nr:DUF2950 domain-containing protein [Gemmatimonadales bacterium]
MSDATRQRLRRATACAALALVVACGSREPESPPPPGKPFPTPEAAAEAIVAAAERDDRAAILEMLGPEGESIVRSEDSVLDRQYMQAFAAQARTRMVLQRDSTDRVAVVLAGAEEWPSPIPIVEHGGQWRFDAAAGLEEILNRRIGANELHAIDVCRGYVEAQREYSYTKHPGSTVNQYAQRVISTPGKRDGLAWRDKDGTWQGPISEHIATLIAEGYTDRTEPFHGYYFKILKGQGPSAPLGEMDFLVNGAMIGGFALVAAPAEYEVTGVKTFIVSHDGIVYEKDLGPATLEAFKSMERYDPDSTWSEVTEP